MVRHLIMWRLKDEAAGGTKAENAAIIKKNLEGLLGKVEGLRFIQVDVNISTENPAGWDLGGYMEFDDLEALRRYSVHPLHLESKKFTAECKCDQAVCDFLAEE